MGNESGGLNNNIQNYEVNTQFIYQIKWVYINNKRMRAAQDPREYLNIK